MKRLIALGALLLACPVAHAESQDIRACDFEVKARCASGDARVTLSGGAVTRLEINAFWCGLPGNPGYVCTIDWSREGKDTTWSQNGGATLIVNASPIVPGRSDRVTVTVARHVSIDLEGALSAEHCGAGAELPRAIVIPAKAGKCRVWLSEP